MGLPYYIRPSCIHICFSSLVLTLLSAFECVLLITYASAEIIAFASALHESHDLSFYFSCNNAIDKSMMLVALTFPRRENYLFKLPIFRVSQPVQAHSDLQSSQEIRKDFCIS